MTEEHNKPKTNYHRATLDYGELQMRFGVWEGFKIGFGIMAGIISIILALGMIIVILDKTILEGLIENLTKLFILTRMFS
jgi:hypothetical protein